MQESSTQRWQRRVHFQKRVGVKQIPCIDDMDEGDIQSTWFTEAEIIQNRQRDRRLISDISQRDISRAISEHIFVASGLETEQARRRRKKWCRNAQLCVLLAQESLWEMNQTEIPSPEEIAEVYMPFSRKSALTARNRALRQDQRAALGTKRMWTHRRRRLDRHQSDPGEMPISNATSNATGIAQPMRSRGRHNPRPDITTSRRNRGSSLPARSS